ncbi:hypothetical protein B0J17DRAFT_33217 [Rhizoctonia solani]|nr:hypothetical protein B0J17DRAFT_33217 [Rhizoctonia solani]
MAANLTRTPLIPLGLELISRQISPSSKQATRILHWPSSYLSASFSIGFPQDDPSLRALHEPYPSRPPNGNIFEPEGIEYASGSSSRSIMTRSNPPDRRVSFSSTISHTIHSNAQLLKCIYQKDYSGAVALRRDLEVLHTPITPRYTYAQVAQYLLDHPDKSDPHAFLRWFELLPSLRQPWSKSASMPPAIDQILSGLLKRPQLIDSLCHFTILAAHKGMARWVAVPAISQVARYSTPEVASRLLVELINAASANAAHSDSSTIPPKVLRSWNSTFIRTLCLSGRVEAAYQSLLALHNDRRALDPHTYRIVSEELEKLDRRKEADHVRGLAEKAGFSRPNFAVRALAIVPDIPRDSISKELRSVKDRLTRGGDISATGLARFIKSYYSAGNPRALVLLRKRLIRSCASNPQRTTLSLWGTAEMQLYRSEGRHIDALSVFQSIFLPVGITVQLLHELGVPPHPASRYHPTLWPPSEAISLASWSAAMLATSHDDQSALERCYLCFLEAWRPAPNTLFAMPPVMRPDAAAFQPWIGAFAQRAGPEGVLKIMGDMKALEVPPTTMSWNALAKAYANKHEWDVAKSILTRMESSRQKSLATIPSTTDVRLRNRLGPIIEWGFPPAKVSTYYTLLRELLATKQFLAAKELVGMLLQNGHQLDERLKILVWGLEKRMAA